ncbi:MAG TPA: hypothetical protein VHO46_07960 [Bacteroidales bacterium]|nr:hypothetical protein [Bacteroidales bacterium]
MGIIRGITIDDRWIDDRWIREKRGRKNAVTPAKPYSFIVEKELMQSGKVEDVAIIFLTNSECPFNCLMCDLWKNTTDTPVQPGEIPAQILHALESLPAVKHIKLYNSGSFFDKRAIPAMDHEKIASILKDFETVILESHPLFINQGCIDFSKMIRGKLEIAIGLETINPEVTGILNKRMTLSLFRNTVTFLSENNISSRAFILVRPPFMTEDEGLYWAKKSIDFAFDSGVECCSLIPVRPGNGAIDELMRSGHFNMPSIISLEKALEYGISLKRGRVFADTWDLKIFSTCDNCLNSRIERITEMNLTQEVIPEVICGCGS